MAKTLDPINTTGRGPKRSDRFPQTMLPNAMARKAKVMALDTPVIDHPVSREMGRRNTGNGFAAASVPLFNRDYLCKLLFHTESVALRTLDALHVAAALLDSATHVVTYDERMRVASMQVGLKTLDL